MCVLTTPHQISDFLYKLLLTATGMMRLTLQLDRASLIISTYLPTEPVITARITCPQFVAHLLPPLQALRFRSPREQALSCSAYWLRYQVHTCLLTREEANDCLAADLDLLDHAVSLPYPLKDRFSQAVVLTLGEHHVHLHSASADEQEALAGYYAPAPFLSQLWLPEALTMLRQQLRQEGLTSDRVLYHPDLFTAMRLRRKLQLLLPAPEQEGAEIAMDHTGLD